jgi:hypothetical protein
MTRLLLSLLLTLAAATAWAQSEPASQPTTSPVVQPPPPAPTPPPPPPAPAKVRHEAESAPVEVLDEPLSREDLETKREILRRGGFSLQMGGLVQVQGAFYVGSDATIANKDPADTAGFRIRRARFGIGGTIIRHFGYYLAVDLKDATVAALGGDRGSEILDARLDWTRYRWLNVSAGMVKVPFSLFTMESSSRLTMIERPLMSSYLAPDRRVGLAVEGRWRGLGYALGCYNGSEGVTSGNKLAGVSGVARLQYRLFDRNETFVPDDFNLTIGAAYNIDDGSSVLIHRVSAGLDARYWRFRLLGEFIWQSSSPHDAPAGAVDAGDVRRWAAAGELSGFVWREHVQLAVRYEYFKDNDALPTFGEQQLISAGANLYLYRHHLKLQINYIRRHELEGPQVTNDIGFAQLQGMF